MKKNKIAVLLLFVAVFLFSLSFRMRNNDFIPVETINNLIGIFRINISDLFNSEFDKEAAIAMLPYYRETCFRLRTSLISAFSGIAICFAGCIFQTVFKNPIASPNILGVSTGVNFGNILFVVIFGLSAYSHIMYRYIFCYGFAVTMVALTVLAGKLLDKGYGNFSIQGMIIVGMVISHLGQVFVTYYQYVIEGDDTGLLEIYMQFANGDTIYSDNLSFIIFTVGILISVLPMYLIRYRFNTVAFPDDEIKTLGISNTKMRMMGLILGSLMATIAMIHCGDIGFLSMGIPFICRNKQSVDFRNVAFFSMFIGGTLTIVSRTILIMISNIGIPIPANVIVTLLALPLFVVTIVRRESAFE